jgi:hypothetical protein
MALAVVGGEHAARPGPRGEGQRRRVSRPRATVLRSSYSCQYRRVLPRLLAALDFRCNNGAYRPVMDAVGLLRRYADRERAQFYDELE